MLKYWGLFLTVCFTLMAVAVHAGNQSTFERILEAHRAMLLLIENAPSNDPLADHIFAARNAYAIKRELLESLVTQIEQNSVESRVVMSPVVEDLASYLSKLLNDHPADLLAFGQLLDDFDNQGQQKQVSISNYTGLEQSIKNYKKVLQIYRNEYGKALDKLTRSDKFETWAEYLSYLKSNIDQQALLKYYSREQPQLFRYMTRGENDSKVKNDSLTDETSKIMWGNELPEKTVVLTFDDGPHAKNTSAILDILKRYQVHAYFFSVGKKMGDSDGKSVTATRNDATVKRILDEGHILANHSYSHAILTKLGKDDRKLEIDKTNSLINKSMGRSNTLFRPPFGSRDNELDQLTSKDGMVSVMWNIDSMDWADPIPESIADRTLRELDKHKKGILLFHDIHAQSLSALPDILNGLAVNGYRVVTLDGRSFVDNASGVPKIQASAKDFYGKNWAVVIGINDYKFWQKLNYAVNDAKAVAEHLSAKLGFQKENIITLYDQDATSEKISEVLGYQLANPELVTANDRVFVFFAGHGATRELPNGKSLGYLIPVDADSVKFQNRAISMTQLADFSALIPAKHMYFVMDSCYSGLALTRAGMSYGQSLNYIQQITGRKARQILTAGGADQQVADGGPGGHSIFTWAFLQGLDGLADTDNNGYVTASELGTYVAPVVSSYAEQTPAFGNLVGSEGGDFVFKVQPNAIAEVNRKLVEESKQVEDELSSLRQNIAANVRRRLDLEIAIEKQKLEIANEFPKHENAQIVTTSSVNQPPVVLTNKSSQQITNDRKTQAAKLNTSALEFFKRKKYEEAKRDLAEAVRLNPYNPTIVNNYAFMLDQLNENNEALKWYYRTVELDAKRTAVYINLGDMMVKLGREQEAIPYYERYLHLHPSYKDAKTLLEKIEEYKNAALKEKVVN